MKTAHCAEVLLLCHLCLKILVSADKPTTDSRNDWTTELSTEGWRKGERALAARNVVVKIKRLPRTKQLQMNVTWMPPDGNPPTEYSMEILAISSSADCGLNVCYEYNIEGAARWAVAPSLESSVDNESCVFRPGCSYRVLLMSHPWDGKTSASADIDVPDCVEDICSCLYATHLPRPVVQVEMTNSSHINVAWTLSFLQALPANTTIEAFFISVSEQRVFNGHSIWYERASFRAPASLRSPDKTRAWRQWVELQGNPTVSGVHYLVKVATLDSRGCAGPAGNDTVVYYKPQKNTVSESDLRSFISIELFLALVLCLTCAACAVMAFRARRKGARSPVLDHGAPTPLVGHPSWLPLQPRDLLRVDLDAGIGENKRQEEICLLYDGIEFEDSSLISSGALLVDWSCVRVGALLGSGAFGRVHDATVLLPGDTTPSRVALKIPDGSASSEDLSSFCREIRVLAGAGRHEHVVRLVGACARPPAALLERAPHGDLHQLLRQARAHTRTHRLPSSTTTSTPTLPKPPVTPTTPTSPTTPTTPTFLIPPTTPTTPTTPTSPHPSEAYTEYTLLESDEEGSCPLGAHEHAKRSAHAVHATHAAWARLDAARMRQCALQIAQGMRHLEEHGIIHRDLAARNVLVGAGGRLLVSDLGLASCGAYEAPPPSPSNATQPPARPRPLRWLAPEAIRHRAYSHKSDVWAYGVTLWEIATLGSFPYSALTNQEVPSFLESGGRLERPARATPRLHALLVACWAQDPHARPAFGQLVRDLEQQQELYVDLDTVSL